MKYYHSVFIPTFQYSESTGFHRIFITPVNENNLYVSCKMNRLNYVAVLYVEYQVLYYCG